VDADVIVVGAGLAGLRCAGALRAAGRDVLVLEAGDAPGGRVRTDRVDGFRVDRGFQLLNPAYPAVGRWVDVEALRLQPFRAGVAAVDDDRRVVLGHPLREPSLLPATLRAATPRTRDLARAARWAAPLLRPRRGTPLAEVVARRPDVDRRTALDSAAVGGLPRRLLDAFLAGVLLEDDGSSADRFVLLLAWMFARGAPSLPAAGMQALPDQLAAPLGDRLVLGQRVTAVDAGSATTTDRRWTARQVVVATDGPAAHDLTGLPAPAGKGVVTVWWDAPTAPGTRLLHVDARRAPAGPLVNTGVISAVAPSYAPPGRHLVAGSALRRGGEGPSEQVMRRHAGDLLGVDPSRWEVVARHDIAHALPAQPVPFSTRRPVAVGDLVVCGDHRDTGSIQGALVSGQRAADAVLAGRR
jgi:glycine/D-amino acid oxidase-like deaminating enzyme